MKILHLVLYSNSKKKEYYEEMQKLTAQYYKKFENVRTIYYKYTDISEEYYLQDNILHIKGTESFIPGVLDKTIKAFEYMVQNKILDNYDVVVRSNISTVINFDLLTNYFQFKGVPYYAGAKVENLQWEGGGITDHKWFGTQFACGISIILSNDAVRYMIQNKENIRMDIIDDVSIAIFHKEHCALAYPPIEIQSYIYLQCFFIPKDHGAVFNLQGLIESIKNKYYIFYRNNSLFNWEDRRIDVIQMKHIIDYLEATYHKTPLQMDCT
jgi:hypothetical protein